MIVYHNLIYIVNIFYLDLLQLLPFTVSLPIILIPKYASDTPITTSNATTPTYRYYIKIPLRQAKMCSCFVLTIILFCDRILTRCNMELLQNKLRPTSLKDVLGQTHIIGKDKVLTNLVKEKNYLI